MHLLIYIPLSVYRHLPIPEHVMSMRTGSQFKGKLPKRMYPNIPIATVSTVNKYSVIKEIKK